MRFRLSFATALSWLIAPVIGHRIVKSHTCDFPPKAIAPLLLWPLLPLLLFAAAMHLGAQWRLLPAPRPALDTDRSILLHQADAARSGQRAEIILLGDSSCLMNVSARQLGQALRRPVLNLATFSFLDLQAQAILLREYTQAHPGQPFTLVLLMHHDTLRRLGSEPYYLAALTNYLARLDQPAAGFAAQANHTLGFDFFKSRLLSRALPIALPGTYGVRYGFTHDLENHLLREHGSTIDPDPQPITGRPEYRLAATLEKTSRAFRTAVPAGTTLLVGISPVPEKLASPRHAELHAAHLRQWSQWLAPALPLTSLPPTLPDSSFTRATHLREAAIPDYTSSLASGIAPLLPQQ